MKDGYELAKQIWIEAKKLTAAGYGNIRIAKKEEPDDVEKRPLSETRGEILPSEE